MTDIVEDAIHLLSGHKLVHAKRKTSHFSFDVSMWIDLNDIEVHSQKLEHEIKNQMLINKHSDGLRIHHEIKDDHIEFQIAVSQYKVNVLTENPRGYGKILDTKIDGVLYGEKYRVYLV